MSKFSKIVIICFIVVLIIILIPTISFSVNYLKAKNTLSSNGFSISEDPDCFPGIYYKATEDDVRICVELFKYNVFSSPTFAYTEIYSDEVINDSEEETENTDKNVEEEKTDNSDKTTSKTNIIHIAFQINSLTDDSKNNVLIVHSRSGIEKKLPVSDIDKLSINDLNLPEEEIPDETEFNSSLEKDISDIKSAYSRAINLFK